MNRIHPSAVIDPTARIAATAKIGPYCIIEDNVTVGENTELLGHSYIGRGSVIGQDNLIYIGAVIGTSAQHRAAGLDTGTLIIGDRNVFREYVTIHRSTTPNSATRIGSDNYLMAFSHVGHDCVLGDNITIANGTVLGGHVTLDSRCILSAQIAVHQFCRIGTLAMLGGQSSVTKDVPPYMIIDNNDEYIASLNLIGMKRGGLTAEEIREIKKAYRRLYYGGVPIAEAAAAIASESPMPAVRVLVDFILSSKRGLAPHRKNADGAAEPVLD